MACGIRPRDEIGGLAEGGDPRKEHGWSQSLLVIMSDEHNPKIAGYAGHRIVGEREALAA